MKLHRRIYPRIYSFLRERERERERGGESIRGHLNPSPGPRRIPRIYLSGHASRLLRCPAALFPSLWAVA